MAGRRQSKKQNQEQEAPAAIAIRDRIVEFRRVKGNELHANPKNWRLHPESQRGAVEGILKEIGFVGAALAREVDGKLELLDGHLRSDIAADSEVPVLIVDLTDAEADKVLATYDPLSSLAEVDDSALGELIGEVDLEDNAELRRLLTDLSDKLIEEEEQKPAEEKVDIPGMALQPHEHYDYLVVLATTTQDWNVLCDRLGLKPEKRRKRMGTCRAIRVNTLLAALKPAEK